MATRENNKKSSDMKNASNDKKKVVVESKEKSLSKVKSTAKTEKGQPDRSIGSSMNRLVKSIAEKVRSYRNSSSKEKPAKITESDLEKEKFPATESTKNAGKNPEKGERKNKKGREEVRRTSPRGGTVGVSRGDNGKNAGSKNRGRKSGK